VTLRNGGNSVVDRAGNPFVGRAKKLISVAENAYRYDTRLDARLEAMNLRLPRPLEQFVLAFNLHSVHHRYPGLPWYELWFTAMARQLGGPISAEAEDLRPVP